MEPVKGVSGNLVNTTPRLNKSKGVGQNSFQDTLKSLVHQVDGELKESAQKTEAFALGKGGYKLHEVMIASEKAGISLRFLLQIRNKLLDAYQEIMRMQF